MNDLHWNDAEDIGIELYEKHPKMDPLTPALYGAAPAGDRAERL